VHDNAATSILLLISVRSFAIRRGTVVIQDEPDLKLT